MILPFKTKWPEYMGELAGKPTYFIDKIWEGIFRNNLFEHNKCDELLSEYGRKYKNLINNNGWDVSEEDRFEFAKIHTIREDVNDRWKPGMMIDFFINSRTKDMFRFAPRLECVSVQKIHILRMFPSPHIVIDGKPFYNFNELAANDGFYKKEQFFDYFLKRKTNVWQGKIIHWTNFKY